MDKTYEKNFGKRIHDLREQKNLTQEQLTAKLQLRECEITRSALAKIEVGQRHVYPDEIFHLKNVLNVTYDDMFVIEPFE